MSTRTRRPAAVDSAFWLWLASAFLLIFFGLLDLTSASYELREQFGEQGVSTDDVETYVTFVRLSGGVLVATGLITGGLAVPTRAGHALCRRILVGISGAYAVLQIALVAVGISTLLALVVPVMLIGACVAIYRPGTRWWFARG